MGRDISVAPSLRESEGRRAAVTPRLLTDQEAAAYLNVPVATLVREGWGRIRLGIYTRYDVKALDALLDEWSGVAAQSAPLADNDAEAALDRFITGA